MVVSHHHQPNTIFAQLQKSQLYGLLKPDSLTGVVHYACAQVCFVFFLLFFLFDLVDIHGHMFFTCVDLFIGHWHVKPKPQIYSLGMSYIIVRL